MKLTFSLVSLAALLVTVPTSATDNATMTSNTTHTPLSACAAFDERSKACGGVGGRKPDECCYGLVCHPLIGGVRLNAKCVTSDMVAQGTVSTNATSTNATSPTSNSTSTQSPEPICAALGEKSKECGGVGGKKPDKCCEGLICHVDGQNADCIEDPNAVTTATTLAAGPTSAPVSTPTSAPVGTTTDATVDASTTMPPSSVPAGTTTSGETTTTSTKEATRNTASPTTVPVETDSTAPTMAPSSEVTDNQKTDAPSPASTSRTGETTTTSTTEAAANTASSTTALVETSSTAPTMAPSPKVTDPQETEARSSASKLSIGLVTVIGAISAFVI